MSTHSVTVGHNFETAHRLPHLGGKCASLHGHSWWVDVTVTAEKLSPHGTVIEFGAFKAALRTWVDTHLDHGTMLGAADPLCGPLRRDGGKLFVVGSGDLSGGTSTLDVSDLDWPTVENVAVLLGRVSTVLLRDLAADRSDATADGVSVSRVRVSETRVNAAEWGPAW
jgi:6-pyruvoyltetrahydropterin/6-carboxytetrahydropterin synthase